MSSSFLLQLLLQTTLFSQDNLPDSSFDANSQARSEIIEIIARMQSREDTLCDAIRWNWVLERGMTQETESLYEMPDEIDPTQPVDLYDCEWLCNNQVMLLSRKTMTPVRVTSIDEEKRIVSTSVGTQVTLQTADSILVTRPNATRKSDLDKVIKQSDKYGQVGNRKTESYFSISHSLLPLHCSSVGFKKLDYLRILVSDPNNDVQVALINTDLGRRAQRIRVIKPDGIQLDYFVDPENSGILQYEQRLNGTLRGKSIAVTTTRIGDQGSTLLIPSEVIFWTSNEKGRWRIDKYKTTNVVQEKVPMQEIMLQVPGENEAPVFSFAHPIRLVPVPMKGVRSIKGSDLDRFVEEAYQSAKNYTAAQAQKQQALLDKLGIDPDSIKGIPQKSGRFAFLIWMNLAVLTVVVSFFLLRSRWSKSK